MGRSILAVLVAMILAISRVSINPTPPQGRVSPSACQSLFIFAPRRCCCLAATAPRLSYSGVRCNAAITLHHSDCTQKHRNTDLNPKYFHRFAFLAFASGTYLKVISITEKEHCHSKL